jgi:hypothetical protein
MRCIDDFSASAKFFLVRPWSPSVHQPFHYSEMPATTVESSQQIDMRRGKPSGIFFSQTRHRHSSIVPNWTTNWPSQSNSNGSQQTFLWLRMIHTGLNNGRFHPISSCRLICIEHRRIPYESRGADSVDICRSGGESAVAVDQGWRSMLNGYVVAVTSQYWMRHQQKHCSFDD